MDPLDNAILDPRAAWSPGRSGRALVLVEMDDYGTAVRVKKAERRAATISRMTSRKERWLKMDYRTSR